jgi:predicted TIM-barrel fold metal-dependent hydrolase
MSSNDLAVDCHLHAHWPQPTGSRVDPSNTAASAAGLFPTLTANGITHCLLIQPGAYAFDNRAMLDVIAASKGAVKAIGALPLDARDEDFIDLKNRGVVGVRLSLITLDPHLFENEKMHEFLRRCQKQDYWVEVFAAAATWPSIIPLLVRSEAKVIAEHIGWPMLPEGLQQPGFQALLEFGRSSKAAVKLSGGFRISWTDSYDDLRPYVHELVNAFGTDRCIWGSDWPFLNPDVGPAKRPMTVTTDYPRELGSLQSWVPDAATRHKILWENPSRFFGFTDSKTIRDLKSAF